MPELPEVEVVRQGLAPNLVGQRVVDVWWSGKRLRLQLPMREMRQWVCGSVVRSVGRRAKYLLVEMDNRAVMVVHLGMSGHLGLFARAQPRAAHDHVAWLLNSGLELRFNDTRRFGSVQLCGPDATVDLVLFQAIGPEPLGPGLTAAYLRRVAARRTRPVKNFLMDSRVVAGIGNIYASEILFAAGIRPERGVGLLTPAQWQRLVKVIRPVLQRAIACGGSTIRDFINSSGKPGYFQLELKVYGREGADCRCCGTVIVKQVMAGRATYFCPTCQA